MAIGGFSGSDPAITLTQFKKLVKEGKVKYFLTSGMGKGGNNDIVQWVEKNGKKVSSDKWKSSTDQKTKIVIQLIQKRQRSRVKTDE